MDDISYEWINNTEDKDALKKGIKLIEEDGNYFMDLKKSIEKKLKEIDKNFHD